MVFFLAQLAIAVSGKIFNVFKQNDQDFSSTISLFCNEVVPEWKCIP